jgi:branched-chain amino acid aminotransferase
MTVAVNVQLQPVRESRLKQVDFDNLQFGKVLADHMFIADFDGKEWQDLRIVPADDISFSPALMAIHYGQSIFEGLKAYRNAQDEVVLFRPDENWKRLNHSAERMCMPTIPEEIFMNGLLQLIQLDSEWVPRKPGCSLYVRPFMFATDETVGFRESETYRFIIITSPVAAYYANPLKVKIETHFARAVQGGVGGAKTAGNYAASLYPTKKAKEQGFDQIIWTDGKENKYVEEAGTMNVFFKIDGKILTAATGDTVLQGITRKSVIALAQHWGLPVEERKIAVEEVIAAINAGKLEEAFGAGTAAVVTPIEQIGYEGEKFDLPTLDTNSFAFRVKKALSDIRTGKAEDVFQWMLKVC